MLCPSKFQYNFDLMTFQVITKNYLDLLAIVAFLRMHLFPAAAVFPDDLAVYLKDLKVLLFTIYFVCIKINCFMFRIWKLIASCGRIIWGIFNQIMHWHDQIKVFSIIYCSSINFLIHLENDAQFFNATGVGLLCVVVMISPITKM